VRETRGSPPIPAFFALIAIEQAGRDGRDERCDAARRGAGAACDFPLAPDPGTTRSSASAERSPCARSIHSPLRLPAAAVAIGG